MLNLIGRAARVYHSYRRVHQFSCFL